MNNMKEPGSKRATISDSFNIPNGTVFQKILDSMLGTTFFLPPEVMNNRERYSVSKIQLTTGIRAKRQIERAKSQGVEVYSDIELGIMEYAQVVGISTRSNAATGKQYIIAKLWYTSNPWAIVAAQKGD